VNIDDDEFLLDDDVDEFGLDCVDEIEQLAARIDLPEPSPGELLADRVFVGRMRDDEAENEDEVERGRQGMAGAARRGWAGRGKAGLEELRTHRGGAEPEPGGSVGTPARVAREPEQRVRDAALARLQAQQTADDAWRARW
jgi:hypothetical protein